MKLNVNFLQTGGVPLTNDLMASIMEAVKFYDVIGDLAGNLTIVSGCDFVSGSTTVVNPGVVAINGELLPFEGGSIFATVFVYTEDVFKTFEDQNSKVLVQKKTVKFGNASTSYNWADFLKLATLKEIHDKIADQQHQIDDINIAFDGLLAQVNNHMANVSNPHAVTPLQVGILRTGSIYLGDINGKSVGWSYTEQGVYTVTLLRKTPTTSGGGDDEYSIVLKSALPTANYVVVGSVRYKDWNNDNDVIVSVGNKSQNGFNISCREVSTPIQDIYYDFVIIQL